MGDHRSMRIHGYALLVHLAAAIALGAAEVRRWANGS
jgi:hypothetical protein